MRTTKRTTRGSHNLATDAARFLRRHSRALGQFTAATIAAMVQAAAQQYGVDPNLALAVAQRESNLNPNAVSSAGAQGVMQLMPATAAQFGVTNPFNPQQNVVAGVKYLAQLLAQFNGDVPSALAAYDWGPGNVTNAQNNYGAAWLEYAPAETQAYVAAIEAAIGYQPPVTTIDADTGEVTIEPVTTSSPLPASPIAGLDWPTLGLLAGAGVALYLLAQSL